jgi:hypothetical protein
MSEITKPDNVKKLQPSQFQRSTMVSKILIVIFEGNANLREGKMALLPYRQGIAASHV